MKFLFCLSYVATESRSIAFPAKAPLYIICPKSMWCSVSRHVNEKVLFCEAKGALELFC